MSRVVPVTEPNRRVRTRRDVVRRRRRERQFLLFGVLLIALAFVALSATKIYRGEEEWPWAAGFTTPIAAFESDITLVCPPANATPLPTGEVVVRVLNGTDTSGLAGSIQEDLSGRGFTTVGAANWSRSYGGVVRIMFGSDGIAQAYTLARQFTDAELVLDSRDGITVDLVAGADYDLETSLRSITSEELDPSIPLSASAPCLPYTQINAEPAPRVLPENPLASEEPEASDAPAEEPAGD